MLDIGHENRYNRIQRNFRKWGIGMNYKQSVFRTLALISQVGISILVPILLCTFLGAWLEERISFPVFIPLIIVGVLAGGRNAYYLVRHANEDPEDRKE